MPTDIQWTDETWNCVRGCSRVSAGCGDSTGGGCYAERQAYRFSGPGMPYEGLVRMTPKGPRWTGKVVLVEDKLNQPLKWKRPRRVFVNSMSDLFHESLSDSDIARAFAVMWAADHHTYQILTKRPERMLRWATEYEAKLKGANRRPLSQWRHVWLGTSVEDQETADERIPLLLQTPAAVRWISAEPLLGPVDLKAYTWPLCWHWAAGYKSPEEALAAGAYAEQKRQGLVHADRRFVDWVVVGGESGPGARPCDIAWIRVVIEHCKAATVPVFVKQLGSNPVFHWTNTSANRGFAAPNLTGKVESVRWLADRKGGDINEWPEPFRVRQYPIEQAKAVTV